ncbi:MAG: hypothetical protein ACFFCO_13355 [Promethearchaeota archaeon]
MTHWHVKFAEGSLQVFLDIHTLCGQYYQLHPRFIKKLHSHIKEQRTYTVRHGVIHSVKDPSNSQLTDPFILLLATRAGLTVSLLGGLDEIGGGSIVGVWPHQIKELLGSDSQAILTLLFIITERPEAVQSLQLLF